MQPKSPKDFLIVKLDKAFQDEIVTESGVKLFKDTNQNPEWNVTCVGKVISVPNRLSNRLETKGKEMEAAVGEEVVFSYQVVADYELRDRDTPVHKNLFYYEGEWYWKVDYQFVLGFIRDEKIVPAQGYLFAEAAEETKTPERIGLIWLPESTVKEKPKGKGRVIAVGRNRTHDPKLSVKEGDTIRYPEKHALKYDIKNKQYVVLDQSRVLATES